MWSDGRPADNVNNNNVKKKKIRNLKSAKCNVAVFQLVLIVKALDLIFVNHKKALLGTHPGPVLHYL